MIQQCVCRDIEHLGSLGSTQEARNAFGCASSNSYASFVLSKLPASSISLHTQADAWTKGAFINYGGGGGGGGGVVNFGGPPMGGGVEDDNSASLGDLHVLLNGFCATEMLSTAWNTMAVQVISTELHTQS